MSEKDTILVVDDDLFNLDLIEEYLENEGYELITTSSGREALDYLRNTTKTIKVIILDWMMPDMEGIQVLETLKQDVKYKHIPVILQTAKSYQDDIAEGMDKGAYQYLTKPFSDSVLTAMVRSALTEYNRFETLKSNLDKKVEAYRESTIHVIKSKSREFESMKFSFQTQQLINQFFLKSLACQDYDTLTAELLETAKQFQFESAEGKNMRCSVYVKGITDVNISDRGLSSQMDHHLLERALTQGDVFQGGRYTVVPSKEKRSALMIRNSPQNVTELNKAIETISVLLEQFDARLKHFDREIQILQQNDELVKKNQQIYQIVRSCNNELSQINVTYQNMKEQQMTIMEQMESIILKNLPEHSTEEIKKISAIINTQVLESMELYSKDQITDQKFLTTIEKLKSILDPSDVERKERLQPKQMSDSPQDEVDLLLQSLGL
ncbi:MAG: response regulator [SAR324 cluster bacterium]|nr:response regulator [SAR324 cluster bacterium]